MSFELQPRSSRYDFTPRQPVFTPGQLAALCGVCVVALCPLIGLGIAMTQLAQALLALLP